MIISRLPSIHFGNPEITPNLRNKFILKNSVSAISIALLLIPISFPSVLFFTQSANAAEWGRSGKGGDGGGSFTDHRPGGNGSVAADDGTGGNGGVNGGGNEQGGKGGKPSSTSGIPQTPVTGENGSPGEPAKGCTDGVCVDAGGGGGGGGGAGTTLNSIEGAIDKAITGGDGGKGANTWGWKGGSGGGGAGGAGVRQLGGHITNDSTVTGGNGGNGGMANPQTGGTACGLECYAGSGGDGGAGASISNGSYFANKGAMKGGNGGKGGTVFGHKNGGNGGDGGNGADLTGASTLFNDGGNISGGAGGKARASDGVSVPGGTDGYDGIGIYAEGDNNIVINDGVISAGGDKPDEGTAVKFDGDNNTLELWSASKINGKIEAKGKDNDLALGGAKDQNFDASTVGDKYIGFERFSKNGTGTANVSGVSTFKGDTAINEGTLNLVGDGSLESSNRVTVDAIFDVSGIGTADTTIQSLAGDKDGRLILGDKGLNIVNGHSDDFKGRLEGSKDSLFNVHGGHQILSGDDSGFHGTTNVQDNATLTVNSMLGGTTQVSQKGILDGTGSLENLLNGGAIAPGNGGHSGTLNISGNYTGLDGSVVYIGTKLGDDNSETSRLNIGGDTSGKSDVKVTNRGGLGAQTKNGIKVIDVGGASNGIFNLIGDYVAPDGRSAVVAGAYAYTLNKGSSADPADGDWYLRSQLKDTPSPSPGPGPGPKPAPQPGPQPGPKIYQPGVPLYSAYVQILRSLDTVSPLQERVGNRYWNGASARQIPQGDGGGIPDVAPVTDIPRNEVLTDYGLFWSQISGRREHYEPENSTTGNEYTINSWNFTAGVDNQLYETETGRFIGGVWFQYGAADAKVTSLFGQGTIAAHGYGGGASLTWYGDSGLYVDGQTKLVWYKNDIENDTDAATEVHNRISGADGFGYALSVEAGKRIALDDNWSLIPQAQLSWTSLKLDDFTDSYAAVTSFGRSNDLTARFGLAANYADTWQGDDGYSRRTNLYGLINLYQSLLNPTKDFDVAGTAINPGDNERTWAGIGVGGTYGWNDNKYSLFGNINTASSLKGFGKNYIASANIGFNVKW
ncbi:autotransporter outer membrane beta-barrel domain-containing protein [Ochrobactrum sp. CM-21-5]|nr:autotransporter outer membrane beta-barrel domain-containing protein [Ochrobactrum sp. CM-21-5]MBC2885166.1 autotransporter outer membrane beta-barrel domain-containing protein [Ochrobactrum sp. CM-21-5]